MLASSTLTQLKSLPRGTLRTAARTEYARRSLLGFTRHTFPRYEANWHHVALCDVLDRFVAGEYPRLIVLMPPRHGKSELVSRRLPAYILGRNPNARIIAASYGADLASRMNRDVQRIIDSPEYRAAFPETQLFGKNVRSTAHGNFLRNSDIFEVVNHQGTYRSAGVGGGIVGMGFDYGIIDDPIKNRKDANSPTVRRTIWDWYVGAFHLRQERNARILITMTPWHPDDLVAGLLRLARENPNADQWHVVRFPATAEPGEELHPLDERVPDSCEPLWPWKYDAVALKAIRANSEFEWNAQYMCRPRIPEGSAVKREWFGIVGAVPSGCRWVRYWDKAGTPGGGAFTAGLLMGKYSGGFIIADVVRGQWEASDRERVIHQTAELDRQKYGEVTIAIEQEGGSGGKESADRTVRNLAGFVVAKDLPKGKKDVRFYPFAAQAGVGDVSLLRGAWNEDWLIEVCSFPNSVFMDQVDTTGGAFNWLTKNSGLDIEFV
jgi:predicted phage terminase large subunit-like protein